MEALSLKEQRLVQEVQPTSQLIGVSLMPLSMIGLVINGVFGAVIFPCHISLQVAELEAKKQEVASLGPSLI